MIPHPIMFFDNPAPTVEKTTMWKKLLGWLGKFLVNYGPGLAGAVIEAKAKKEAETPPQK